MHSGRAASSASALRVKRPIMVEVDAGHCSLRRATMVSVCRCANTMEAVETHLVSASGWREIIQK